LVSALAAWSTIASACVVMRRGIVSRQGGSFCLQNKKTETKLELWKTYLKLVLAYKNLRPVLHYRSREHQNRSRRRRDLTWNTAAVNVRSSLFLKSRPCADIRELCIHSNGGKCKMCCVPLDTVQLGGA
jgi:hypothetical protein